MNMEDRAAHDAEARDGADIYWHGEHGGPIPDHVWAVIVETFDRFHMRPMLRSNVDALLFAYSQGELKR